MNPQQIGRHEIKPKITTTFKKRFSSLIQTFDMNEVVKLFLNDDSKLKKFFYITPTPKFLTVADKFFTYETTTTPGANASGGARKIRKSRRKSKRASRKQRRSRKNNKYSRKVLKSRKRASRQKGGSGSDCKDKDPLYQPLNYSREQIYAALGKVKSVTQGSIVFETAPFFGGEDRFLFRKYDESSNDVELIIIEQLLGDTEFQIRFHKLNFKECDVTGSPKYTLDKPDEVITQPYGTIEIPQLTPTKYTLKDIIRLPSLILRGFNITEDVRNILEQKSKNLS